MTGAGRPLERASRVSTQRLCVSGLQVWQGAVGALSMSRHPLWQLTVWSQIHPCLPQCVSNLSTMCLSLVLDGSRPSALLTLFGSLVLQCLSALVPYRTGPGVLPRLPDTSAISSVILVNRLPHQTSPVGAYVGTRSLTVA